MEETEKESEHSSEKIINEGNFHFLNCVSRNLRNGSLRPIYRVQDLEKECAVPLRYDAEHSSGVADAHYPVAAR